MSLKLANLMILSGFAPGPEFIGKKKNKMSGIKILTCTSKVHISLSSTILKLSNLLFFICFAPGPKFRKKNAWNWNSDEYLRRFVPADRQQVVPLIVSETDLPLGVRPDDYTIFIAT